VSRRIYESTISLRLLGIILRVLRLEVSVYNVYITNLKIHKRGSTMNPLGEIMGSIPLLPFKNSKMDFFSLPRNNLRILIRKMRELSNSTKQEKHMDSLDEM
jgi:hypothetical protein